jgi:hypothetical protein
MFSANRRRFLRQASTRRSLFHNLAFAASLITQTPPSNPGDVVKCMWTRRTWPSHAISLGRFWSIWAARSTRDL